MIFHYEKTAEERTNVESWNCIRQNIIIQFLASAEYVFCNSYNAESDKLGQHEVTCIPQVISSSMWINFQCSENNLTRNQSFWLDPTVVRRWPSFLDFERKDKVFRCGLSNTIASVMSFTGRRHRQQIFETAFVSSTKSSTEDLDEVDRIANHPVLRESSEPSSNTGLRRSRSEMGGSVDRGVSAFLARSPGMSPVTRSLVIQDFRSGGINRGLSRSTTACSALSNYASPVKYCPTNVNSVNPEKSPVSWADRSPQTLTRNMRHQRHRSKTPIRSRVTAIIEGSSRKCITPPPNFKTYTTSCNPTPPNTAPLPKKTRSPVSNFEDSQFHDQNYSSHSNSSCLSQISSGLNLNKLPSFTQRKSFEEQISSSESTPQKHRWSERQGHGLVGERIRKMEKSRNPPDINRNAQFDNQVNRPRPNIYQSKNFLKVQNKLINSKDSSACSSLVSSMESVESNTSEGKPLPHLINELKQNAKWDIKLNQ